MGAITGTPEEVLTQVEALVQSHMPGAVCELQRYKTQIGCGALDERGFLHEVTLPIRNLSDYLVTSQARAVASHFLPRRLR